MLCHLFKSKKMRRKEANAAVTVPIYRRGAELLPADYLTRHQEADSATKGKVLARAAERRKQRNAKRIEQ